MIKQYQLLLRTQQGEFLHPYSAYWLYSLLVKSTSPNFANLLHEPTLTPLTQSVTRTSTPNEVLWQINLFGENSITEISALMETWEAVTLERLQEPVVIVRKESTIYPSVEDIVPTREARRNFYTLHFVTPTTFKSDGEYALFPSSRLIIQSLVNKWNAIYPHLTMKDEDAIRMLQEGFRIRNYKLNSTTYPMGGLKLPGFMGYVELQAKLSDPIHELWHMLYCISPYTGIGVKTALGMGAVTTKF